MRTCCLLWLVAAPLVAQSLSFGVKGGVPLTDAFSIVSDPAGVVRYAAKTRRYTLGPTAELRLPFGLGIEVDALYKRLGYSSSTAASNATTTANSWEFPFLLKLRMGPPLVKPYAGAGVSFRRIMNASQFIELLTGTRASVEPAELRNRNTRGFVLAAGIEVRALLIRIAPELRFTRWGAASFDDVRLRTSQNQAEFLVGITF